MDKIKIYDLEVFANHGVFPEENVLGQKFVISLQMDVDTKMAGKTDCLDKSVNYGEVSRFVSDFMQRNTYKLLEAAAENLAQALLLEYPLVYGVNLEIKKPWAPVKFPLKTVSVEIYRRWHKAYVALGANMGNEKAFLDRAVSSLDGLKTCRVKKVADYIVTKPYGGVEQDDFLNSALELDTLLAPEELLMCLHEIEAEAGRQRTIHWGPRTLDLDILLYDDMVMDEPDLTIPHREMHLRDFVLRPMAQIAPYQIHPICKKTIKQLLAELTSD
ncbi:MAG: 2-amino-4-hydroxy-6-hydroxymethyldihydropteridine diphosphokinase [Eubacteriales bacterium]|nr:2-amino-4-hydroxy-6-hydroxymethyldihydropteridine diphosphokinase [Eubacteriales bacterium]